MHELHGVTYLTVDRAASLAHGIFSIVKGFIFWLGIAAWWFTADRQRQVCRSSIDVGAVHSQMNARGMVGGAREESQDRPQMLP